MRTLLLLLLLILSVMGCSNRQESFNSMQSGTIFGNPNRPVSPEILASVCEVLSHCNPQLNVAQCQSGLASVSGVNVPLGLSSSYSTFGSISSGEVSGAINGNPTTAASCANAIEAQSCTSAAVEAAYNPASATPFAAVPQMIPAISCSQVYATQANPSMTTAQIQTAINAAPAGSTFNFAPGTYNTTAPLTLPCNTGVVYTGPSVGTVTIANAPTAIFSLNQNNYVFATVGNGTGFTSAGQGCTIQNLEFTGKQGGIFVPYPSSGILIQNNYFTLNDGTPSPGTSDAKANIWLDGYVGPPSGNASLGVSYVTVTWNVFYNECATVRAVTTYDTGAYCTGTVAASYSNYLTYTNNTVDLIEQAFKEVENQSSPGVSSPGISNNLLVENNNLQGNSRKMIEGQQDSNGNNVFQHNAIYQPNNPTSNTAGIGLTAQGAVSPVEVLNDNVLIADVPITASGSTAHYGYGIELWGTGSQITNNLIQGGNGPDTCSGGPPCSGWTIEIGYDSTGEIASNNIASGYDVANQGLFGYEDGATAANVTMSSNTITATSAPQTTHAPTLSPTSGTGSQTTVTITDSDTTHGLTFFYTTDGSTPAIFPPGGSAGTTRVYTGPFTVAAGTTVNAIAHWGQGANQGIVFPSFGWVPSSVVSVSY